MPILIDAYNLYYHVQSVYAEQEISLTVGAYCRLIEDWSSVSGERVTLVFDGGVPKELDDSIADFSCVKFEFSGRVVTADDVIAEKVTQSTAPKLLTVVSSDNYIRSAAKKRRCKSLSSQEFWLMLAKKLTRRPKKSEPREKRSGMTSADKRYWYEVFGVEED